MHRQISFSVAADNISCQAIPRNIKWWLGCVFDIYANPTSMVIGRGLAEVFKPDICLDEYLFLDLQQAYASTIEAYVSTQLSLGSFVHRSNGLPQPVALQAKYDQLKSQYDGGDYTDEERAPFERRSLLASFGLIGGFFLGVRGWQYFDNERLGCLGLGLLWLTSFPSTWG
jgi:hypothetical protein